MSTSADKAGERVVDVRFTNTTFSVDLLDGRTITVPIEWFPRLKSATPEQRRNWQMAGADFGIHWPEIDEDISVEGLLLGARAHCDESPQWEGGRRMIRKLKSGEYRLYSKKKDPRTGKRKNLGTFRTRTAAEKHERAVQYFKRKGA